ncbi:diphthamide synthase domain-containing protein [Ditylenchus destructor]|nr:diphthamide synthase domain-containing protein [Ditylenchus destructor]
MKVAALISGGKDSFYNMMCCQNAGHEIVCLGNLYPPAVGEIDSYMYQSVGSEGIETIAKALELPLIRQEIRGTPKNLEMIYTKENGDEVEDLHLLITKILEKYRDVKGVSVGAINSTYQKERVKNICERFGIVPLCLLWERNQLELLDEMIGSGINAILIKVAGMGLNSGHLSKNLREMKEHLLKMHEKYGSHVCGEGGEYESFVLDSPLHKKRIEIVDKETVIHDQSDVAPVAYLKLNKLALVEK